MLRNIIAIATTGLVWYVAMQLFFVWSGAQKILGNPAHQSSKFIKAFIEYEPLPLMATDSSIVWKGLMVVGAFLAIAFLLVNHGLKGGWLRKGLLFGLVHWMMMTPWFEFYLPYNVMREPFPLVLLEGGLWLCVALITGLYLSFVVNFRK